MAGHRWVPVLLCVLVSAAAADGTLPVRLSLPRKKLASDTFVVTETLRAEDMAITFAARSGYADRPEVPVGPARSFVGVTVGSLSKRTLFGGVLALSPTATRVRALKLKRKRTRKPRRRSLTTVRRALLDASIARTAVRDGDFSVQGPRTEPWMALAGRDVVATAAQATAACYGQPDGFVLLETGREFFAARDREIALCQSGAADPSTCFDANGYQPPNAAIGGTFVSDGTSWTIALAFTDENGRTDVTTSAGGDYDGFVALLEQAGARAGAQYLRGAIAERDAAFRRSGAEALRHRRTQLVLLLSRRQLPDGELLGVGAIRRGDAGRCGNEVPAERRHAVRHSPLRHVDEDRLRGRALLQAGERRAAEGR